MHGLLGLMAQKTTLLRILATVKKPIRVKRLYRAFHQQTSRKDLPNYWVHAPKLQPLSGFMWLRT